MTSVMLMKILLAGCQLVEATRMRILNFNYDNRVSAQHHVAELEAEVFDLSMENATLKQQLATLGSSVHGKFR